MKKSILPLLITLSLSCHFKDESISGISTLPSLDLLLIDSSTIFNTSKIEPGNPIILIYFSPDCEHCQQQIAAMLKHINYLKRARILLFTPMPFGELKSFYEAYHIDQYKNIMAAEDYEYSFNKFYKISNFPCTLIYNDKKQLIKLYKQEVGISQIIEAVNI